VGALTVQNLVHDNLIWCCPTLNWNHNYRDDYASHARNQTLNRWKFRVSFPNIKQKSTLHHVHISPSKVPLFVVSQLRYEKDAHIQQNKPAKIVKEEQNNWFHFGWLLAGQHLLTKHSDLIACGIISIRETGDAIEWVNCSKTSSWWAGGKKSRPGRASDCNEGGNIHPY
jgi:hypothetical protein